MSFNQLTPAMKEEALAASEQAYIEDGAMTANLVFMNYWQQGAVKILHTKEGK